ncbi:MAG: thiamine-binding protein [Bacteroidetes bacterium]|nr:thiamine-binding protein [Bacteroidota bacterium]
MLINATIQVIPLTQIEKAFPIVDKAIELIQQSGISFSVGAFETTLEGEYEAVQQLLRKVEDFCYSQKEVQFLVYSKLHLCGGENILAESKTAKFK